MKTGDKLAVVFLMTCLSFVAHSQDNTEMKKMIEQQALSSCDDQGFVSCIGISKSKCISAVKKAMRSCDHLFSMSAESMDDTTMNAPTDCLRKSLMKSVGINERKLDSCGGAAGDDPDSGASMDAGDISQFQQLAQRISQAKGTHDVTLPVYKPATIVSHTGEGTFDGGVMLPALIMWSGDKPGKIVNFYRKKLKAFKEFKVPGGILFMQHAATDFALNKDLNLYFSVPHVMVTDDVEGLPSGAKSRIEIGYKK